MASGNLKIGVISDLHIGETPLVQGIDVRANFLKALHSNSLKDMNLLVLLGDLADDCKKEAYQYIAEEIKNVTVPICIIPGNHDDLEIMSQYFDIKNTIHNGKCYFKYNLQGKSLFFLDSGCGTISREQLSWLKEEASKEKGEILLFVHHPPCLCHHRFMDSRYALQNIEEVQEVLTQIPNLNPIICGHYHTQIDVSLGNKKVHVIPSTQMQIDPNTPHFSLKSSAPGWGLVEIGENFVEIQVYF